MKFDMCFKKKRTCKSSVIFSKYVVMLICLVRVAAKFLSKKICRRKLYDFMYFCVCVYVCMCVCLQYMKFTFY